MTAEFGAGKKGLPLAKSELIADEPVWRLFEEAARRLGLDAGNRQLKVELVNGYFRRAYLDAGPLGKDELEAVGATARL